MDSGLRAQALGVTFGFNVEKTTEALHTRTYRRSEQGIRDVAGHGCAGYAHGKTRASIMNTNDAASQTFFYAENN